MVDRGTDIVVAAPSRVVEPVGIGEQPDTGALTGVLCYRWRTWCLVTILTGVASCFGIWYFVHPNYEVTALIRIASVVRPILFSDPDADISRQYSTYMATQAEVIRGPAVIQETLKTPEVRDLPSVLKAEDPEGMIKSSLTVNQVSKTELVRVSMVGRHPGDMAVIVNNLLDTYLRRDELQKRSWDEQILRSLRTEQKDLQSRLEAKSLQLRQLAVEGDWGTGEGVEAALDGSIAELWGLMTQANREHALAVSKLTALEAVDDQNALFESEQEDFRDFVGKDRQWQSLREQLSSEETGAINDARFARGPNHPDVAGRSERIAAIREALASRELELREPYRSSLRQRLERARLDAEINTKAYRDEIEQLKQQRSQITREAFSFESVRHEREQLEQELAQVRQKIWNVEIEQNRVARITVASRAQAPTEPNIDKRLKYTAAACVMSLFLGVGAALIRQRFDTSVRNPEQVTDRLGMPLLGSVQRIPKYNGAGLLGDERMREPIRGISTALLTVSHGHKRRSRAITSPTPRSGKSSMAANLARTLASTGRKVLLVDADNAGQGVTHVFEMTGRPGLNELLAGACPRGDALHACHVPNLTVLPAGQRNEQFGELLTQQRAQGTLCSVFEAYDEVIVDSPPVLASSNAVILATLVDEVVLVLRAGKSTKEEVQAAQRQLAVVGDKLVGVILNAVDPKSAPYSYYPYAYAGKKKSETT